MITFGPDDFDKMPEEVVKALQDLIGKTPHGKRGHGKEKLLPEVVKFRVEEGADIYAQSLNGCPYSIGNWVTARKGYGVNGHGRPYKVVDTRTLPSPDFVAGEAGNINHGRRVDMRIMSLMEDNIVCFWAESYQYEPYDMVGATASKKVGERRPDDEHGTFVLPSYGEDDD